MTRYIKLAGVAVTVILVAAVAWAGLFGPGKKSKEYAEKLLEVFRMAEILPQSVDALINQMADQDPNFLVDSGAYRKFAEKYITWEILKPKYVKIYTDMFTEDELRQMAEFYDSPVGRKNIEKMGELMMRSSQLVSAAFDEKADELDEMVSKERIRIANELLGLDENGKVVPVEDPGSKTTENE